MNIGTMRRSILITALQFISPGLRTALLNTPKFAEEWEFPTIPGITLGKEGPSFQCDQFYGGVRRAIRNLGREVEIKDQRAAKWRVTAQAAGEGLTFIVSNGVTEFSIGDQSGLAEDGPIRLKWFFNVVRETNLPVDQVEKWKVIIESRPLDDQEFAQLNNELELTPAIHYKNLRLGMVRGSLDLGTLVPSERTYYNRLIGVFAPTDDAARYVHSGVARLVANLQAWEPNLGFLHSLLLCSRDIVAGLIDTESLGSDQLVRTYQWIANHGDPISQVGSVEIALLDIERHRDVETFIEQMVEGFIADDPIREGGMFSLLSAMIVLVASELSRRWILKGVRPFYRRQAAIAQASIIVRAMYEAKVETSSIVEWERKSGFGYHFLLQGLVDLREEPRWLPDFVSPSQLRAEFIGRVANAMEKCKGRIYSESLRRLLIGSESRLARAVEFPFPMLPGPLEGEVVGQLTTVPEEMLNDVARQLEGEELEPTSFAGLVNMALLFKVPASHAGLAAKAIRRVRYSIERAEDEEYLFELVAGLARVAAVTRGTDLAEELRVLVRVMRRRRRLNASPDDEMRVAMMAAAAHEKVEDWARFFGEWMTELAYEIEEGESAQSFLPTLRCLVQIEPALARHCAAADAALESVAG